MTITGNCSTNSKLYNPEILDKQRLVVANKMDLPEAKKNLARSNANIACACLEISALERAGLDKLKLALRKALA